MSNAAAAHGPGAMRTRANGTKVKGVMTHISLDVFADLERAADGADRSVSGQVAHYVKCGLAPAAQCMSCRRMTDVLVRLHVEGVLSEGQASKAIGIDRIELRKLADELAPHD